MYQNSQCGPAQRDIAVALSSHAPARQTRTHLLLNPQPSLLQNGDILQAYSWRIQALDTPAQSPRCLCALPPSPPTPAHHLLPFQLSLAPNEHISIQTSVLMTSLRLSPPNTQANTRHRRFHHTEITRRAPASSTKVSPRYLKITVFLQENTRNNIPIHRYQSPLSHLQPPPPSVSSSASIPSITSSPASKSHLSPANHQLYIRN